MSSMDRRQYDRVAVDLDVIQTSRGRTTKILARNIGYGGMQVAIPEGVVQWGDRLDVEFRLPASRTRFRADALVVYKTRRLAGLRFLYIPRASWRTLDQYVSTCLAGSWFD